MFQTRIRRNIRLAEAPSFGQSIFPYAPDSHGADDYQQLALEVLAAVAGGHPAGRLDSLRLRLAGTNGDKVLQSCPG